MNFLLFNYFIFLCLTLFVYYLVNNKQKNLVIFLSCIIFIYSISPNALLFSLIFTIINFFGGLLIYNQKDKKGFKRFIFYLLLFINIGLLIFFKYINFIFESINLFFGIIQLDIRIELINIILPIGISYYTFQSIGYLVRISRGFEMPEKNFVLFSNFLLFFPKFISGPVERSNHFLPQIKSLEDFSQTKVSVGLRLILFGIFKKVVIADNLYSPVSLVYSNIHNYAGMPLIMILFIQLIYIYCDFSGYTDIALGSAKLLGIDIIDNFNRPFLAKTITEFWKRWHISLSSWCNEFIYFPFIVKYRKWGNISAPLGILLTFTIIGIWHGSNWTFIILGFLQALAIIYEFFTKKYRLMLTSAFPVWIKNIISRILVIVFMGISMVFFFSKSISDALYFLINLFKNIEINYSGYNLNLNKSEFILAIICFMILYGIEILNEKGYNLQSLFIKQPKYIRWTLYYFLIILIYLFNSNNSTFQYMKF